MLNLSFLQLTYCLGYYPEKYLELCNYCNSLRSDPMLFQDAWDILINICPESSHDILEAMKLKILMALYTAVSYEQQSVEPKSCIQDAYQKFDSSVDKETAKRTLSRSAGDLRQNKIGFSGSYCNNINLQYLSPFWNSDEPFKCLNALDFYFYIKNYKHWAFYPDNTNGMTFYEWFKGIQSIVYYDKPAEDFHLAEEISIDKELSAYITEQLFHPIAFCKNVLDFCEYFGKDFNNKDFLRESAMQLFIPLSYLPVSWQEKIKGCYSNALEKYLKETNNVVNQVHFSNYLKDIYFKVGCLESFAEAFLATCLLPRGFQSIEGILPAIKETLSTNITDILNKNPDFSYYSQMHSYLNKFRNSVFPTTDNGRKISFSDDNTKKRNNRFIETFEINYTFYFSHSVPLWTLTQHHIATDSFMTIDRYIAQHISWFYYYSPQFGYNTRNYFNYKIKSTIPKTEQKKDSPKKEQD